MQFSLMFFSFVQSFKRVPKYSVHADFNFFVNGSPSFVGKLGKYYNSMKHP